MAEWEKEIAELKTDVKYIREDIGIMQKQVRDLNKHTNMGLGGIRVLLIVGAIVGAIWTLMKIMSGIKYYTSKSRFSIIRDAYGNPR